MKGFIKLSLFILLIFCFSCEDYICYNCEERGWFVECSECKPESPENATLNIQLKKIQVPVIINIYEGELEDSILYASRETGASEYDFAVTLNKKYTVTATYRINENTYIAVDSATPKVKYTEDQCDEPCYYVYDRVVDLRLKYTAKGD